MKVLPVDFVWVYGPVVHHVNSLVHLVFTHLSVDLALLIVVVVFEAGLCDIDHLNLLSHLVSGWQLCLLSLHDLTFNFNSNYDGLYFTKH